MDSQSIPTTTQYQEVVVQVPEDRVAEFHTFLGRFLAGPSGRRHRGRHGGPHRGHHGRRCAERRSAGESGDDTAAPASVTQV
jgi:hypothetical protein